MDSLYIVSAIVIIIISIALYYFFFREEDDIYKYKEDFLYEVPWRWNWNKKDVVNLKCHCPKCDDVLVYENDYSLHKTYFICESCEAQMAVIGGGDSNYAFGIVKREIHRKIRTEEYKQLITNK